MLTVSDGVVAGTREDRSGDLLVELLVGDGFEVQRCVVPDEREEIAAALRALAPEVGLVLTTGGTGLAPRDVTPEVTMRFCEKEIPGIAPARMYDGCTRNAYHLFMFRCQPEQFAKLSRARFLKALSAEGIPCSSGYAPIDWQAKVSDGGHVEITLTLEHGAAMLDTITIVERPKQDDSVEVHVNGEFIGVIFKDVEDGETSYAFNMAILEMDLPQPPASRA